MNEEDDSPATYTLVQCDEVAMFADKAHDAVAHREVLAEAGIADTIVHRGPFCCPQKIGGANEASICVPHTCDPWKFDDSEMLIRISSREVESLSERIHAVPGLQMTPRTQEMISWHRSRMAYALSSWDERSPQLPSCATLEDQR